MLLLVSLLMLLLLVFVVVKFSLVNTLGSRRGTIGWDCPGGSVKTRSTLMLISFSLSFCL